MTKPPRKPRAKPTMHKPKRLCRNQLSICKKAEILRRILYDKVRLQDICEEFDSPASTVCTWKKNSDKILADSVKAGKKRKRMRLSKYKDVELALLYWIKDMRSRDHPPPWLSQPTNWGLSWLYGWKLLAGAASSSWSIAGVSSLSPAMASASPGRAAVDLPACFSLHLNFSVFLLYEPL